MLQNAYPTKVTAKNQATPERPPIYFLDFYFIDRKGILSNCCYIGVVAAVASEQVDVAICLHTVHMAFLD